MDRMLFKRGTNVIANGYRICEKKVAVVIADIFIKGYVAYHGLKKRFGTDNRTLKISDWNFGTKAGMVMKNSLTDLQPLLKTVAKGILEVLGDMFILVLEGINKTPVVLRKLYIVAKKCYGELWVELVQTCKRNRDKIARVALISGSTVVFTLALVLIMAYSFGFFTVYTFTAENWMEHPSQRIKMVSNFEEKYEVVGMNQMQVEELLGPANLENGRDGCDYKELEEFKFDTVSEYSLNSDSMSPTDLIEKHYVVAYKNNVAVWAEVMISDVSK